MQAMTNIFCKDKFTVQCIDEPDGSLTIHINWDETDPDLKYWTELGEEKQKSFMIDALYRAMECYCNE